MAIVTLRIPDDTLERYKMMHPSNPSHAMEKQLERFKGLAHTDRALIFPNEDRKTLEGLFGRPIEDVHAFVEWVQKLVSITVGGLEFVLKAGQRKKLDGLANFYKKPFDVYAKAHLSRIIDQDLGGF
jgi:hypothetical protein